MLPSGLLVTLMIALLATPMPMSAGPTGTTFLEDHPPIRILSDADLLLPDAVTGNGVVGGTGRPDDPFVIRGWRIDYAGTYGITITGTTSHILVQNVELMTTDPLPNEASAFVGGLWIDNAQNVRFEQLTIRDDSQASILRNSILQFDSLQLLDSDLWFDRGKVDIRNATMEGTSGFVSIACNSCQARLVDVTMTALDGRGGIWTEGTGSVYELERVVLRETSVSVEEATFTWKGGQSHHGSFDFLNSTVLLEDLSVQHQDSFVSDLVIVGGHATVRNVRIDAGGVEGITHGRGDLMLERVLIVGGQASISIYPSGDRPDDIRIVVRNSTLVGAYEAAVLMNSRGQHGHLDLRYNYWGSPEGPVVGESKGYRGGVPAGALVDPWLTESPLGPIEFEPAKSRWLPGPAPLLVALALVGVAVWRRRS